MRIFDLFSRPNEKQYFTNLHERVVNQFPQMSENRVTVLTCLAGLLARVAYVDFNVTSEESKNMHDALIHWIKIEDHEAQFVANLAVEEIKSLAGVDTRTYCKPLVEILDIDDRFSIVETLFELAASDGSVDNVESNEISYINKALVLEQKHFIAAKAKVSDFLASLKK